MICENIRNRHSRERDTRALFGEKGFSAILLRSHQMYFAQESSHDAFDYELATRQLAILFQMNVRTVRKYLLSRPAGLEPARSASRAGRSVRVRADRRDLSRLPRRKNDEQDIGACTRSPRVQLPQIGEDISAARRRCHAHRSRL
jgi:hypothetical protein